MPEALGWLKALMGTYPHADPERNVRTRFGGAEPARFLICGSYARAWAPVRPEVRLPDQVRIAPTHARKRRDWIIDVILNPPRPPFLAASVGLSGSDADYWKLTTSAELIAFGGSAALFEGEHLVLVERGRFCEAMDWFAATGTNAADILRSDEIKRQFQTGILTGTQARFALDRLRADAAMLRSYPGSRNAFLTKLAAYAAQTRHAGDIAA